MTNDRVQIPAYTDRWMMGDRYGELVKVTRQRRTRTSILRSQNLIAGTEIAHVKLDKSGKTVRVILADCNFV